MRKLLAVVCLGTCLLAIPLLGSRSSLQKGQVIKQFYAFSITQSLANGAGVFETRIPCGEPSRTWVEEPPVFHFLASLSLRAFPNFPAMVPILAFVFLGWAVWVLSAGLEFFSRIGIVSGVMLSPALLRYSIQHLPDLFATLGLTLGAAAILRRRNGWAIVFLGLAVTSKALTVFAAAPLLFWAGFRDRPRDRIKAVLQGGGSIVLISLPFLLWILAIFHFEIASPFRLSNVIENRHSGGLDLLWSPGFYARFFTWSAIKGTGLILFCAAAVRVFHRSARSSMERLLLAWSLGIVPYWLLVRQGNFVHDYYSLPFVVPIALLGSLQLLSLRRRWVGIGLLVVNVSIALIGFVQMAPMELSPSQERPYFCGSE